MKMVNRTAFTSDDATDLNQVGSEFERDGKVYRYVQAEDAALAANEVVAFSDTTSFEVTKDRSGGSAISVDFAGVAVGTITDGNYGFVQVGGPATCLVPANTAVAAGARVALHSTGDGAVVTATTTTLPKSFGVALAGDTATTSTAGTVAVMISLA